MVFVNSVELNTFICKQLFCGLLFYCFGLVVLLIVLVYAVWFCGFTV